MSFCSENKCNQCCIEADVPLLQEDIDRITALGYYDVYFTTEYNGVKSIRKIDGKCIFFQESRCEIYDRRPRRCHHHPITYDDSTKTISILDSCRYKNFYDMSNDDRDYMEDYIGLLLKEIELRLNYHQPKADLKKYTEKLVIIK